MHLTLLMPTQTVDDRKTVLRDLPKTVTGTLGLIWHGSFLRRKVTTVAAALKKEYCMGRLFDFRRMECKVGLA